MALISSTPLAVCSPVRPPDLAILRISLEWNIMNGTPGDILLNRLRSLLHARENAFDASKQRVIVDVPHGVEHVHTTDLKFKGTGSRRFLDLPMERGRLG
jgi:hypothetical protein